MNYISIIGIAAGSLTTLAFFPQAYKIISTKDTRSISLFMYVILITGISLWVVYGAMKSDIPVILANSVTLIPAIVILAMKIVYKNK